MNSVEYQVWNIISYHFIILHQHHVVGAQSSNEDDTGHTFETMDPLLPLRPLAAHIKHSAREQKRVMFVIAIQHNWSADDELSVLSSWEIPHWLTWNGDLWRKTGSRWYRWSSLLIAAHPAQWARSLVGSVAPSRSGSWGMNRICSITNTNERLCDHLKSQLGWFLTIQRSRWAGTLRPCQSTPVCQSPSTGAKWCLTAL